MVLLLSIRAHSSTPWPHPDERSPEIRLAAAAAGTRPFQRAERRTAQCGRHRLAALETRPVEEVHPVARRFVVDFPQTHDESARARHFESATKSENTFAGLHLTEPRVARGKNDALRFPQIQGRDLFRGEDSVFP